MRTRLTHASLFSSAGASKLALVLTIWTLATIASYALETLTTSFYTNALVAAYESWH